MQKRFLTLPVFLLLLLAVVAACAAPIPTDQASIDQAVQATLTAVVADPSAPAATPAPEAVPDDAAAQATPIPDAPAAIPQMVLPPEVPNFDPVLRPDKALGDPNAPVVMYEWSDYT